MGVLRSQRIEVLDLIREADMEPLEFEWEEPGEDDEPNEVILRHKPSGYWFMFIEDEGAPMPHRARFSPGRQAASEEQYPGRWDHQLSYVETWLAALRREVTAPDLWRELERERDVIGELGPVENTPFTPEEQQQIVRALREVKEYVRSTQEVSEDQFAALEARLDYLAEAVERLGRLDWRNALIGVLLGAVVEAVLPAELIRGALSMIVRTLGSLFGGGGPPELL